MLSNPLNLSALPAARLGTSRGIRIPLNRDMNSSDQLNIITLLNYSTEYYTDNGILYPEHVYVHASAIRA